MTAEQETVRFEDLCNNPQEHGFTKIFRCDRCASVTYCAPDFDPPSCPQCNPEQWNGTPA